MNNSEPRVRHASRVCPRCRARVLAKSSGKTSTMTMFAFRAYGDVYEHNDAARLLKMLLGVGNSGLGGRRGSEVMSVELTDGGPAFPSALTDVCQVRRAEGTEVLSKGMSLRELVRRRRRRSARHRGG